MQENSEINSWNEMKEKTSASDHLSNGKDGKRKYHIKSSHIGFFLRCLLSLAGILVIASICLHFFLLDGIDGFIFRKTLGEDSVFAPGYSEKSFRNIKKGMTKNDVIAELGEPITELYWYAERKNHLSKGLYLENGEVVEFTSELLSQEKDSTTYSVDYSDDKYEKIIKGMEKIEVLSIIGKPLKESLIYSRTESDSNYRIRVVIIKNERVIDRISEFYVD